MGKGEEKGVVNCQSYFLIQGEEGKGGKGNKKKGGGGGEIVPPNIHSPKLPTILVSEKKEKKKGEGKRKGGSREGKRKRNGGVTRGQTLFLKLG